MKKKSGQNILKVWVDSQGIPLMILYRDGTIKMKKHGKIN
jgi:hypothetical protein